jgi:hypothetical protein
MGMGGNMGVAVLTYAQVAGGIRSTIAAYAQAVDDGRPDDIVTTFCPDGSVDLPGASGFEGHGAIRAMFSGLAPQLSSRHVVVNIHVTEWSDDRAKAISDLAVVSRDAESGWGVQLVGRYLDTFHNVDGLWRFHTRKLAFVD